MSKIRSAGFIFTTSILLATVLARIAVAALVPSLAIEEKSFLEGREYQKAPILKVERIADGIYQAEFEKFISDSVPYRSDVLLVSASLQRSFIKIANIPFLFDVYPTFFGSAYLVCPSWASIVEMPDTQKTMTPEMLERSAEAFSQIINCNPDIRWRMALVDRSRNSLASPAHNLVAKPADQPYLTTSFEALLPDSCTCIDLSNDNADLYYEKYFKTDHHWQIEGAMEAYQKIAKSLRLKPIDQYRFFVAYPGPFFGSMARVGRITNQSDYVDDIAYNNSSLKIKVNNKSKNASYLGGNGNANNLYKKANEFENVYARYFHGDPMILHLANDNSETNRALVIIGDSFTNNIERLFAEHYRNVYVIDPRSYDSSLQRFFDEHDIDDAVFVMGSNTIVADSVLNCLQS